MAGYVTIRDGRQAKWHIGEHLAVSIKRETVKVQADGDELTFALGALGLPNDHDPRVQTFDGPAARRILWTMP